MFLSLLRDLLVDLLKALLALLGEEQRAPPPPRRPRRRPAVIRDPNAHRPRFRGRLSGANSI